MSKKENYPKHIQNLLQQKFRLQSDTESTLYKKVCSDINFHIKRFFANYESRLMKRSSTKPFLRSKLRKQQNIMTLEDDAGNIFINDAQKANALAKHFSSVFSPENNETLRNLTVDPNDVFKYLKTLKPSMSAPYDGIPQVLLKRCAASLCKPLTMIFNISLLLASVPYLWKEALVTAIPKAHSITSPAGKILEKILRDKLVGWLTKHHLIPNEQHGFSKGASTTTQLLDSTFDWSSALNMKQSIDVIYFDLSKAFDKLILKCRMIGLDGNLLNWL
ncbi:hypothetical protein COOONC_14837, partial [Cooperia oncophora]